MGEYAHQGSKENLLGKHPSGKMVKLLSNELQVKTNTPPCFIWCTYEDKTVPMENSLMFAGSAAEKSCAFRFTHLPKGRPRHGIEGQTAVCASASVGGGLPVLAESAEFCGVNLFARVRRREEAEFILRFTPSIRLVTSAAAF